MSKFVLRMLPGIDRPAIAAFFPTERGETVMLDLGANVECDADNLVEFAVMGEVFARAVLGIENRRSACSMSVRKSSRATTRCAAPRPFCAKALCRSDFHGFVEGDDIPSGTVDVVVTDGFTGNIALKTAEGTAKLYIRIPARCIHQLAGWRKIGYLLAPAPCVKVKLRIDPRRYNGAMFLGLNGIAVKSHGGTDACGLRQRDRRRGRPGRARFQRPDQGGIGSPAAPRRAAEPAQAAAI